MSGLVQRVNVDLPPLPDKLYVVVMISDDYGSCNQLVVNLSVAFVGVDKSTIELLTRPSSCLLESEFAMCRFKL